MNRRVLARAYRVFDRLLLSRLPLRFQRKIVTWMLHLARLASPDRAWPASAEPLLARRIVKIPSRDRRVLPEWARQDMADLALRVDPLLSPARYMAVSPSAYVMPVHWTQPGEGYHRIRERIRVSQVDTVLLVPWLVRGGADLAALHHARACHEMFDQRTLVISTEPGRSPWAGRLPQGVHFLEIGGDLASLSAPMGEPELVLARLLIQLAPARIHIINSRLAWSTVEKFGLAIRQETRIYASLYCDDRGLDGVPEGLAQDYLPTASRWLEAVITDNTVSPEEWVKALGVERRLFHVVHFPRPDGRAAATQPSPQRLLWAGRLVRQKRPELLAAVVEATPEFEWDIHGPPAGANRDDPSVSLEKLPNATLHGPYDDFNQIAQAGHLAFVYTSAWDGLPNVLLEAANAGLAIVAPDIGGIRDLIPRGLLLPADSDADAFARAIRRLSDPHVRSEHIAAQQERLAAFTWDRFVSGLEAIPGYAQGGRGTGGPRGTPA